MSDLPQYEAFLGTPPKNFFMTIRDIGFWIRSAKADSRLDRGRADIGTAGAFDRLYAGTTDPYGSELPQYRYQRRKYESLLSILPGRRYTRALDIGCGLGVFTRKLAPFVDQILGTDISAEAVNQARALSVSQPNIAYAQEDVLGGLNRVGEFDLIILADTLYYIDHLTDGRLQDIGQRVAKMLAPGGLLLVVNHYFFGIDAASKGTRQIHDAFRWAPSLNRVAEYRRAFYLATLLAKTSS